MFAAAEHPSLAGGLIDWSRLFALQPEPDLEFTEEELEQTTQLRSTAPMKRPKKSGGRPLLWVLLLVLGGGATYVAMEPEIITDVLGPLLGEESLSTPSSTSMKPVPPIPAPRIPAAQPGGGGTPAASSPITAPVQSPPVPAPTAAMPVPTPSAPAASPVVSSPAPMFGEGQKVTVASDPAAPGDTVSLTLDPAGTKPGAAVRPGTTLTILDGDLQAGGWVYSVRSDDGAKGWAPERRLRLKP